MPYLVAAPALLAAAALCSWGLAAAGLDPGRKLAAAGAWAALGALVLSGVTGRGGSEFDSVALGLGAHLGLRLDPLALAFGGAILLPVALTLTLRAQDGVEAGLSTAAALLGLIAVEAKELLLTALALGGAASLAMLVLGLKGRVGGRWTAALGASLALAWAGVSLNLEAGTSEYAAIPVNVLAGPLFALIAVPALVTAGTLPWRTWLVDAAAEGGEGGLPACVLLPVGLYLLARMYAASGGHYPSPWLNAVLSAVGAATVVTAAVRSQAASNRRAYLAESVAAGGGFALIAIGLGTPLGLAAGVSAAAVAALTAALLPMARDREQAWFLLPLGLAAGAPPGLTFGVWLVALQAAFEARDLTGFFAVAGLIGWLVLMAAGARALRLPAGSQPNSRWAAGLCGLGLAAGGGLGLLEAGLGLPAAAAVMPGQAPPLSASWALVATSSAIWPAVGLGLPLVVLGLVLGVVRPWRRVTEGGPRQAPAALFEQPWAPALERVASIDRAWLKWPASRLDLLSARMERGPAVLWVVVFVVIAFAVTR